MSEEVEVAVSNNGMGMVALEFSVLQISALIFIIAGLTSIFFWFTRNKTTGNATLGITILATVTLTVSLVIRYINVGHIPYVQLYETYLFTAWSVAIVAIIADFTTKSRLPSTLANIITGMTLIYIIQWPDTSKEAMNLVPALQSPWLDVHIATAFLAYAGFAISAAASIIYLIKRNDKVDELSYKLVTFAFPLLGMCIFLGAVWANEAWGRYWGWDPKETASLVTWLVYAGYLHTRVAYGWKGFKASLFNLIGFVCVIFTWVGLSLIARVIETQSMHVY